EEDIDGNALVDAKHWSEKRFRDQVEHYRKLGFSDRQIINAMARVRAMIDRIGDANAARSTRQVENEGDEPMSINPLVMVNPEYLNVKGMITRAIDCLNDLMHHPQATPEEKNAALAASVVLVRKDVALAAFAALTEQPKPEPPKPARKPRQRKRMADIVPPPPSLQ